MSSNGTITANVIFVIGGPGAGKGTLCSRLARECNYQHLSAGDLLRVEASSGSERGKEIAEIQRQGKLVPSEITVELLRKAIEANPDATGFLIDGFPRNVTQSDMFENGICKASSVINLEADEEITTARILARAATSGRTDDNVEALRKRFATHREQCQPVIAHLSARVITIQANGTVEEVYAQVVASLKNQK